MNIHDAYLMARREMDLNSLQGWELKMSGALTSTAGRCNVRKMLITLSRGFVKANDEWHVRDVVLHEIAHALAPYSGHNQTFKRTAKLLGCQSIGACVVPSAVAPEMAWVGTCKICGKTYPRNRIPAYNGYCPDDDGEISWKRNRRRGITKHAG